MKTINNGPICLSCNSNPAQYVSPYGYLNCKQCQDKQKQYKIKETVELVTDEIKDSRKLYSDDIAQKFRGATANKRYIELYGTEGFSEAEVKNARDVYAPFYSKDEKI